MVVSGAECRPAEILLVEDNPVDALMTREALKDGKICNRLHVVEDGEEAMDFLYHTGKYESAPTPDLILLDLNLPKKDGREVLSEIKQESSLKHIPVVVLTTSEDETDIFRSYELQANCFITKPVDLNQFTKAVKCIGDFWFTLVKLPSK
jgi:two-component system, chemotaxis family, response regulator Rcp1